MVLRRRLLWVIPALVVVSAVLAACGGDDDSLVTPTAVVNPIAGKLGTVERDVTYCAPDGVPQKMDVYYPAKSDGRPAPVAVYVHGGGWTSGDKGGGAGALDIKELVARGYFVGSLNYRLAPKYAFPAMIEDVKCAIRSLRAHADQWFIDPERIGAWGGSAGGHLVSMLGATDSSAGFDKGEYLDQSSRVQAVVDLFGPADLTAFDRRSEAAQQFGGVFRGEYAGVTASPVTYISKDDPPFLILQGELDRTVPASQSQLFYDRLVAGGVSAKLVMVKNAGHGFAPSGGPISPSRAELTRMIADFFDEHVKSRS